MTILQRGRNWKIEDVPGFPLRRVLTSTVHDLHYHDGAQWQDVVEDLADDTTDGYAVAATRMRHIIRVGTTGTRRWYPRRDKPGEYVSFGRLQSWTGSTWQNVNLGTHTRTGNKVSWSNAAFDLSITNNWHRIKLFAVLKTETARRRLRWAVALTGLTYNQGELTSIADGQVVGYVERPVAWDANGSEENQNVTITTTYAGGFIEFGGDLSQAVLPITIDPTFTDGYGGDIETGKDTYVSGSTNNNGKSASMTLTATRKGLFEFDLSSIPADATCDSAAVSVFQLATGAASAFTLTWYSIASGNAAWIEGTKNGALAGAGEPCWDALAADGVGGVTTAWAGSAGLATSGTDYESTALGSVNGDRSDANGTEYAASLTTSRVEGWFGASNTNYGLLSLVSAAGGGVGLSDHTTTGYRPKLVVTYTESGATFQPAWARNCNVMIGV
jgi:hypothetical protein